MATFYNQATLRYNNTVTNSNVASGELVEVLSVTKTAVRDTYQVGEDITYAVSILNSGTVPFNGLTVTDDLGAYTVGTATVTPLTYADGSVRYYVNGVLQPAPAVVAGPPLQISGISVPAGGNALILYEAQVNSFAPPIVGGTVDNTVTIAGGGVTPVTATETVTARDAAALAVTKSITPAVVTDNSRVTYTLTLQNTGNTAVIATDDAVISDTFDPILTDLVVSFNGVALTEGTDYTYDPTTGAFATLPGVIAVPAATYAQDPVTGEWTVTPGVSTLTIVGTI
jgi:uncharacterized repeat protein (TIGR01451 family)